MRQRTSAGVRTNRAGGRPRTAGRPDSKTPFSRGLPCCQRVRLAEGPVAGRGFVTAKIQNVAMRPKSYMALQLGANFFRGSGIRSALPALGLIFLPRPGRTGGRSRPAPERVLPGPVAGVLCAFLPGRYGCPGRGGAQVPGVGRRRHRGVRFAVAHIL